MEAKDTVISLKQVTLTLTQYPASYIAREQMEADYKRLREQANISFSLGKQEGRKGVAKWIEKNRYSPVSGWHLVSLDIEAFKRGEIPSPENKEDV